MGVESDDADLGMSITQCLDSYVCENDGIWEVDQWHQWLLLLFGGMYGLKDKDKSSKFQWQCGVK